MDLKKYFEETEGMGIIATSDSSGKVDMAVYSRPHFMEDNTIAFIMTDRLTHENLQSNNQAAYLFREEAPGYRGKRLYLTKLGEEQDSDLLYSLRNERFPSQKEEGKSRFLVFFRIDHVRPLIGED